MQTPCAVQAPLPGLPGICPAAGHAPGFFMHFRSDSLSVTRTLLGTSLLGSLILASQRIQSPKARRIPCTATSAKRDALLHQFRDAFYVKGYHSGRYLGATHDGHVIHDEVPTEFHLFVFVPGMDVFTGFVKLYHLASDRSIFVTPEGLLGCYHGDFEEHWWRVLPRDDKGSFSLVNFATEFLIYSNSDGRLGSFLGDYFEDQLFWCEHPARAGTAVLPIESEELVGVEDAGFLWEGCRPVYTDAFQVRHYVRPSGDDQLQGLGEVWRALAPIGWGSAADLKLEEMQQPHRWAIEHIPFLKHLAAQGLISERHARNCVYAAAPIGAVRFRHNGLRPLGALGFALEPTSNGRHVPLERSWKRAWHGSSLHHIEGIASEGLRVGKKGIYLSPSFQYTFCLYSLPDLCVDHARFRLVVEVRVRPGAFSEHGDHYKFCELQHVEPRIPLDCLEWEVGKDAEAVQVVGLVLKQLKPSEPSLRHDTNIRHGCQELIARVRQRQSLATVSV
ncbi:unnamed protein product [Durusdinium trenchii]|uniref:Uncharacterized protein n=1 Tax=Durusdinium trenchii TaxID=1381693 RepID=A0ABP0J1S4_9DINO